MRIVNALAILFLVLSGSGLAQVVPPPSGLRVGFRVEEYFSESYIAKSREGVVFFPGEPITFRLIVRNMGSASTSLSVESVEPSQLFTIMAFKAPWVSPESASERPIRGGRFFDEDDFEIPISFSTPVRASSEQTSDLRLGLDTVLSPTESVQWVISIASATLTPGLYRTVVKVNGTERTEREVRPLQDFANIRFEVRPRSADAQPEIVRREALRRFFKEDYQGARQAVADLLRIHRNSYDAYRTLEMIANAEGNSDEAARHRNAAEEINRGDRDELRRNFNQKGHVN